MTFLGGTGQVTCELRKPFDILADGVEEEKDLIAKKVPFSARNKIWLPNSNPLRNVLSF